MIIPATRFHTHPKRTSAQSLLVYLVDDSAGGNSSSRQFTPALKTRTCYITPTMNHQHKYIGWMLNREDKVSREEIIKKKRKIKKVLPRFELGLPEYFGSRIKIRSDNHYTTKPEFNRFRRKKMSLLYPIISLFSIRGNF